MIAFPSWILLLVLPGAPLAVIVSRKTRLRFLTLAAALPAVSLAVNFMFVWALPGDLFGTPVIILYLGAALAATMIAFRRHEPDRPAVTGVQLDRRAPHLHALVPLAGLLIAVIVATIVWLSSFGGLDQPLPNFDGANHGFLTARIIESGTNNPSAVVLTGPEGLAGSADYYPLALHSTAAMVKLISGTSIAVTLNVGLVILAGWALPLTAWSFARVAVPDLPWFAAFAPISVVAIQPFPYKPVQWGGMTLIAAMALTLGLAALLIEATRSDPRSWYGAAYAALASAGIFHLHNTELILAVVLAGGVLVIDDLIHSKERRARITAFFSTAIKTGSVLAILLLPFLANLIRGGSERSSFDDTALADPLTTIGQILTVNAAGSRRGVLLLFALTGLAVFFTRRRPALPIIVVGFAVLAYWTNISDSAISQSLAFPWWRQIERLIYVIALLAALAAAVAVGAAVELALRSSRPRLGVAFAMLAIAFSAAALWIPGAADGRTLVWAGYEHLSPVTDASRSGFDVAADIAGPDGVVITEWNIDGGLWMYAEAGVYPLTALGVPDASVDATWADRATLLEGTLRIGSDPAVNLLVEEYRVRAVYVDERTYPGATHALTRDALLGVPGLTEVFHKDTVSVFEVDTSP